MLNWDKFFNKYNNKADLEQSGIEKKTLEKIYDDYTNYIKELEDTALSLNSHLRNIKGIHVTKYRVKDPEHLIEKIIRRAKNDIDESNYKEEITDLIGARAIHLFKNDLVSINKEILSRWDLIGKPEAYIREGDIEEIKAMINQTECDTKIHKRGYRSVHYVIKFLPTKIKEYPAEIQVRTIFEEAWSEMDHQLCYPYNTESKILEPYFALLNRMAGSADELGLIINFVFKQASIKRGHTSKDINDIENKTMKQNKITKTIKSESNIARETTQNTEEKSTHHLESTEFDDLEKLHNELKIIKSILFH